MSDMDEWDCVKCGAYCLYRESSLCKTCEDKRLLFRNSMRLWFDENQMLWVEASINPRWEVTGKHRKCIVDQGSDIRKVLHSKPMSDGDILVWVKIPGPYDGPDYKEGEDYIPRIVADLNYHDSEFFTKLEEAINGR